MDVGNPEIIPGACGLSVSSGVNFAFFVELLAVCRILMLWT
jgi:hypothetical protein